MKKSKKQNNEYLAFISYQRKDEAIAKRLQHTLEFYNLPIAIIEKEPELKDGIRPIFVDMTELGDEPFLKPAIEKALKESRFLIVICSPRSAKSKWVNKEVQYFLRLKRTRRIIPFIIEGTPNAHLENEECCTPLLQHLLGKRELLGVNINEMGFDAAAVKVVSRMFHIGFRTLWNRYEKEKEEEQRKLKEQNDQLLISQSRFLAEKANQLVEEGDSYLARLLALEALPKNLENPDRPYVAEAEAALRNAANHNSAILRGHKGCVSSAVFSPENSNVISVSDDSTIKIWGAYSGSIEKTITDHTSTILSICYNKEKSLFVTASVDQNVIIWDSKTYDVKKVISHPSPVYYAAFSPDGKYIVTASKDSIVRIWDWNNVEKPIRELVGHTDAVRVVNFSPDNTHIVSGSDDFTIKVWDLTKKDSDACIKSIEHKEYSIVRCADYNKTGDIIIVTADTDVYLLDVNDDYNLLCPPLKNKGGAWWACFSPNEKTIATTSYNDVCLWEFDKDKKKCQLIKVLRGHRFQIIHLSFSDDGSRLLSSSSDETIRLWDFSESKELIDYQMPVVSVALFPKTDIAVLTNCENSTQLFSVDNGEILITEDESWSSILNDYFVFVDSKGNTVYRSNGLRVLRFSATSLCPIGHLVTMQTPQSFFFKDENIHFMTISPDGKYALTAFKEGMMFLWNTENGIIVKGFDETQNRNKMSICGAFDPSGKIVAIVAWEKTVQLWDTQTGVFIKEVEMPHNYWGNSLQFSSDGKLLVSASQNNMVHVWNLDTGRLIHNEISNNTFKDRVLYAEFSSDNKYIITTTSKGTISIFEKTSGVLIETFDVHDTIMKFFRKAMFSIDSKKILVFADNGVKENSLMSVISFIPIEDLIKNEREIFKHRVLTSSEKRRYYIE